MTRLLAEIRDLGHTGSANLLVRYINQGYARQRAIGERGIATLNVWRILDRIRCTVTKTGNIAQAILVYTTSHRPTSGWNSLSTISRLGANGTSPMAR